MSLFQHYKDDFDNLEACMDISRVNFDRETTDYYKIIKRDYGCIYDSQDHEDCNQ